MISQLSDHTFSAPDVWLGDIRERMDSLGERLSLQPEEWWPPGLGRATGTFVRLGSGRVILLAEYDHAVEHLGSPGPSITVDPQDIAHIGRGALLQEIRAELGLAENDIATEGQSAE